MSRRNRSLIQQSFSRGFSKVPKLSDKKRSRFSAFELLEHRTLLSSTVFTVTTANDFYDPLNPTAVTLRDAINSANSNPGQDTIAFNIPGTGVHTISLLSALPTILEGAIIDGSTQPGYVNVRMPLIQLDGTGAGPAANGLDIAGGDTTVQGLAIDNFKTGAGINISGPGNNTIVSDYIGVDPSGTLAMGNNEGVVINQSDGNHIGLGGEKNVISGNDFNGVRITGSTATATGNSISNNFIGTNLSGDSAIGNGGSGVYLDNVSNTLVNGNIISGNGGQGVAIHNSLGSLTTVQANYIGVDVSGSIALPNYGNGVFIFNSTGITIGGSHAIGNVISGNYGSGVSLDHASFVTIAGNNIGTDLAGGNSGILGNLGNGVLIGAGSHDNTVGGTSPDLRNLIDGSIGDGIRINTGATAYNLVIGNHIGSDEAGTMAQGNFGNGIHVLSAGATISDNLISGNYGYGIYLGAAATVQGNLIGTQGGGLTPLPNVSEGIYIESSGSVIGGSAAQGNVIAFNGNNGVTVLSGNQNTIQGNSIYANTGTGISIFDGTQNTIRGNSIYGNSGLGIDLIELINGIGVNGVTPNGPANTLRTGPNNYVNYPVLSTAMSSSTSTIISGSYVGLASSTYTLELFSSTAPDPTLYGQGKTYIGSVTVTTDVTGNAIFTTTVPSLPAGQSLVTATATDDAGNTSEFSLVVQATVSAAPATTTTTLSTSNECVFLGASVTFTATVTPSGTSPLSGTVTFKELLADGTYSNLGTVTNYTGGPATLTTSTLGLGIHNIVACFTSSDSNYSESTSSPVTETVKTSKVTINGTTFRDTTGDGLSGDDGALAGVTVNLYRDVNNNGVLDSGDGAAIMSVTTDATTGAYNFGNLTAGRYFVQQVTPTGYVRTAPALSTYYTVNSSAGTVYSGRDFDNYMKCNDRQWVTGISYSVNGSNTWFSDLRGHIHEGNTVKVRFTVASNHTAKLTLVSYTAPGSSFDANKAYLQSVYQFATGTFSPGMHTMQVTIPASYFQVDFVCGDYIDHFGPAGSNVFYSAQNRLISADNGGCHTQLLSLLGAQDNSALNT